VQTRISVEDIRRHLGHTIDTVKNTVANQQIFITKTDKDIVALQADTNRKVSELQQSTSESLTQIKKASAEDN